MWGNITKLCDCYLRDTAPTHDIKDTKAVYKAVFRRNTFNWQQLKAYAAAEAEDRGPPVQVSKQRRQRTQRSTKKAPKKTAPRAAQMPAVVPSDVAAASGPRIVAGLAAEAVDDDDGETAGGSGGARG